MKINKCIILLIFLLHFSIYSFSQNSGVFFKINLHHLEDLHFFILENETLDLDIRKLRQIQSFQFGINNEFEILNNFSFVGTLGVKKFQRPISDRHRLPNGEAIFDDIKLRATFVSISIATQFKIHKFSMSIGYTKEFSLHRKLIADNGLFDFQGQDWADGFYKKIDLVFAQINIIVNKRWSVFCSGAIHTQRQKNIYFISLADFISKQSQFSIGVQYDIWAVK